MPRPLVFILKLDYTLAPGVDLAKLEYKHVQAEFEKLRLSVTAITDAEESHRFKANFLAIVGFIQSEYIDKAGWWNLPNYGMSNESIYVERKLLFALIADIYKAIITAGATLSWIKTLAKINLEKDYECTERSNRFNRLGLVLNNVMTYVSANTDLNNEYQRVRDELTVEETDAQLTTEVVTLRRTNRGLVTENTGLIGRNTRLQQENTRLNNDNIALKRDLARAEDRIKSLEDETVSLKEEQAAILDRLDRLESERLAPASASGGPGFHKNSK